MGIAGSAFDYAIENFIVGFGRLYITGTGETIDALWSTVRDIFNLTFIFGLVYIGFKMILDSSDSSARKMLVSLIGAALLVNFSLFITKFIVDFSNIAATQVYNAFETTGSGPLSITNGFMTIMGINSILDYKYTAGGSFAYVLGVLLIFCTLAYVFLAGAIMIIIRFVVLNIYMVFSPFMFLGWVFPALQSYSRDYWSGFLRQAFFAPAFVFMLYLSYMVASTFPVQRNLGLMFNPNASTITDVSSMIPYFAMVMVFLCASMVVAKKMGAHGSTMAVSVGKNMAGRAGRGLGYAAGGATAGLAARAGRTVVGGSASALTKSKFGKSIASSGILGRGLYQATSKVADASFDARKFGGVGKALGIGEGKKGGFTTRQKEREKADKEFKESLGTVDDATVANDPAVITAKQNSVVAKVALDAAQAELATNTHVHRIEIAELSKKMENASEKEKQALAQRIIAEKYKIEEKEKAVASNLSTLDKNVKDATSAVERAETKAQYQYQIKYNEVMKSWERYQKAAVAAVGITAGIGASMLTGGLAAPLLAGAAGAAIQTGNNYSTRRANATASKEYGKDGTAKKKKKQEDDNVAKLAETVAKKNKESEKSA